LNNKKILFAINNLTYGGIQTQALTLAKEFQKKGAKIYFFWTTKYEEDFVKKELIKNGFNIIDGRFIKDKFWGKYSWRLQRYVPLIKTILLSRFYGFDYVIPYHDNLCHFFGTILPYTGAKKTIFHIRNTVLENKPRQSWHLKKALHNQPVIIANSIHAGLKFQEVYGNSYNLNVSTIYNGLRLRNIDHSKNWKSFFGVDRYDFVVSSIANFFKEKDYSTVFKAWKLFLESTNSNAVLLIAGDEGAEGMMKLYKQEVKQLGIDSNVIFLGRSFYNMELLSITNCNILSTQNEGLPNVVIETIGIGAPFIGTNVEGVREVVGENYPIPLFKVGNEEALCQTLTDFFDKKYDLDKIKKYSALRFQKFSTEALIKSYSKIIKV
jgi:glycosyltransferase involved in cell wall biosynthesis